MTLPGENGQTQQALYQVIPDTFDTHDDLRAKNPLAPYTLRALDENGQPVTLLWNEKTAEFHLAYQFPTLFEGVGAENPRLIAENLDQIPFIPIEDIQSGLAAQSVLLAMQESGYQPFSEEALESYKTLGGNSLLFVMENDGKRVMLKPKGNDKNGTNYFNTVEKMTPYWFRVKLGETIYDVNAVALLDPLDAQNPQADEFKILFGIPVVAFSDRVIKLDDPEYDISATYSTAPQGYLMAGWFRIYGDEKYQQNHPLLSQLLSIEGNDAHNLPNDDGKGNDWANISGNLGYLDMLDTNNRILETQGMRYPLPPQLQQMILLFEVGVAQ